MTTLTLNKGQQEAVNLLLEWYNAPNQPFTVLNGRAGRGKSFTVKHFLEAIQANPLDVCLSAPTNNLVNAICDGLPGYSGVVIHSLLGYYPRESSTEQTYLVKGGNPNSFKIIPYKLVILDEAYYTPKVLMDAIFTSYPTIKWLFLGDPDQLPPVGEQKSYLSGVDRDLKYKYKLTQNMRATCPIQEKLMDDVCEQGWSFDFTPFLTRKPRATRKMADLAENGDNFAFLAYRHVVVDESARYIRECIYDISASALPIPGEIIRVSGVVDIEDEVLVRQNEIVKVISYHDDTLVVERSDFTQAYLPIDKDGEVESLKQQAIKSASPKDWKKYHKAKRMFVKVSSKYALTVHSSQGLTTDHAIIDLTDVRRSGLESLLYVAISRSRSVPTLYY